MGNPFEGQETGENKLISAILIDDEKPALRVLEYLLRGTGDIEVVGTYTNPLKGIEAIAELKPQAVFLDINMPRLSGMDVASMILDHYPVTHIVFVTAYDEYAVEAFELYALDYILKPVTEARLGKTIIRLKERTGNREAHDKRLVIRCMGGFQIGWDGEEPIKWRTEKTRELFALLLHNKGKKVTRDEIIETLWPDMEPERAAHQLHNAVYYIRETLEEYGVAHEQVGIIGGYRLTLGEVETDVERFRERCEGIMESKDPADCKTDGALYPGAYFEGCGWLWAEPEREKLLREYVQTALILSGVLIEGRDFKAAEDMLTEAYGRNPYDEGITALLLELYDRMGARSKVAKHYREYSGLLKNELSIEPSRYTQEKRTNTEKEILIIYAYIFIKKGRRSAGRRVCGFSYRPKRPRVILEKV